MVEKLKYITLADGQYPIKCDLAVLEEAQEEYGSLRIFEKELGGLRKTGKVDDKGNTLYEKTEPSMKAVRFALVRMVNEGIDIENQIEKTKRKHIKEENLWELLEGTNIFGIADSLYKEFLRNFESKNPSST